MISKNGIRVALYTQQPFVARGLAAIFETQPDFELSACPDSLSAALSCLKSLRLDVLVVHSISGISLSELRQLRSGAICRVVLWGQNLEGEFAFQAMQLGVRGILPGTASIDDFLTALRSVHRGVLCFESELLESVLSHQRVSLTPRQGQIVSLVAQGFKNKEIAFSMGISVGTVKVYLYKLFKKLGTADRLDLALYGRKNLFSGPPELERIRDRPAQHSLLLMARKQTGASVVH